MKFSRALARPGNIRNARTAIGAPTALHLHAMRSSVLARSWWTFDDPSDSRFAGLGLRSAHHPIRSNSRPICSSNCLLKANSRLVSSSTARPSLACVTAESPRKKAAAQMRQFTRQTETFSKRITSRGDLRSRDAVGSLRTTIAHVRPSRGRSASGGQCIRSRNPPNPWPTVRKWRACGRPPGLRYYAAELRPRRPREQ